MDVRGFGTVYVEPVEVGVICERCSGSCYLSYKDAKDLLTRSRPEGNPMGAEFDYVCPACGTAMQVFISDMEWGDE